MTHLEIIERDLAELRHRAKLHLSRIEQGLAVRDSLKIIPRPGYVRPKLARETVKAAVSPQIFSTDVGNAHVQALRSYLDVTRGWPSRAKQIASEVCGSHGHPIADLVGPSRKGDLLLGRRELAYRLRTEMGFSAERVGKLIRRDHSTVLHSIFKHVEKLRRAAVDEVRA